MKKNLSLLAAGAALCALTGAAQAHSGHLHSTGLSCNTNNVMVTGFDPDALACSGAFAGNDTPQQAEVLAQLAIDFGSILGSSATFSVLGKSDDANSGPFTSNPNNSTTGTLTFDTAQTGFFAITLKAADSFSTYLFNGGSTGLTSVQFSTAGTAVNQNGQAQGLSHATFIDIGGTVTPIPEPETYALMLAGLGAVGFIARRRKNKQS
jgi:hypothetical protein